MIRRQLPTLSPVEPTAILRAVKAARRDPEGVVTSLETALADRFSADHASVTSSGTDALRLALETAITRASGNGRLVALPAFSCFDLATAAVGADARVVFYDVDPVSLGPDPDSLARALDSKPVAVVVGNLFGFPLDWGSIRALCEGRGVTLVEDAAQGLGAIWQGREAGAHGDLSVLSFGRGKGWTGGGGGALLARDSTRGIPLAASQAVRASPGRSWKLLTVLTAQWMLGRPSLYGIPASLPWLGLGETRYREPGALGEPAPVVAALVAETETAAHREVEIRRECAAQWRDLIACFEGRARACEPPDGGAAGYLRFPLLAVDGEVAAELGRSAADYGVARSYPRTLAELEALRDRSPTRLEPMPGADLLARTLLTLPCHSMVNDRDRRGVGRALSRLS